MKYVLILWVCSFIEGNGCLPPYESEKVFDSWYECSRAAHKESLNLLQKMGYKIFDKKDEIFFKYNPIKKFKKTENKKLTKESPFKILKNLNLN